MARPSGSRSVGTPATSTGRSRSRTKRRTTASCWASFSPRNSTSGCTTPSSLVTMTATPSKWLGARGALEALGERRRRRGRWWRSPPGTSRRPSARRRPRRPPPPGGAGRGPRRAGTCSKSSPRPNCVGFTKTEAATPRAARPRRLHQAQVPGVQGAHRGHEAEGAREVAQRRPRLGDGPGDDHGWPPAQCPAAGGASSGRRGRRHRRRRHRRPAGPAASPTCSSSRRGAASVSASRLRARYVPRQPRALAVEQAQVRAHGADVAARDRPGQRERRLAALQQVLHRRLEQRREVVEAARVAGGLVHEPLGLALERHQQVAAHHGREVVERLLLVGQAEGPHAEADGELLAELQVAFLERGDRAGNALQKLGVRLAGERLQRMQAEDAHALLVQRLEQVHRSEAAGVDRRAAGAHPSGGWPAEPLRACRPRCRSRRPAPPATRRRPRARRRARARAGTKSKRLVSSSAWTPTAETVSWASSRPASTVDPRRPGPITQKRYVSIVKPMTSPAAVRPVGEVPRLPLGLREHRRCPGRLPRLGAGPE